MTDGMRTTPEGRGSSLLASRPSEDVIRAVAYCRVGGPRPDDDASFAEAKRLGLLAQDSVWRATERGMGALVAFGLVEGEPAPERLILHATWARHAASSPSAHWPQFVGAWSDGFVDACHEWYLSEKAAAEAHYRTMVDDEVAEFFVTVIETPRPS